MNNAEELQLLQLLTQFEHLPYPQIQNQLVRHFKKSHNCTLEDFAVYYLSALRQNTEQHFRNSEPETPKCQTPVRQSKPPAATPVSTSTPASCSASNSMWLPMTPEPGIEESQQSNISHSSAISASSVVFQQNASTPVRQQQGRRSTGQLSSTPQSSERKNRSGGVGAGSFCLGDFMVSTSTQSHQRSKKKTAPQQLNQQQSTTPKNAAESAPATETKPKRRVLPMTISKNVSGNSLCEVPLGSGTSAFSNENNLWRLSLSTEQVDRSQCAALEMEERKTLLLRKHEIKNEAPVNTERRPSLTQLAEPSVGDDKNAVAAVTVALEAVDLTDITNGKQLKLLAVIYAQLMDLNLVPNVLSELCYTLQLLNIRESTASSNLVEPESPFTALAKHKNCIYFAKQVLEQQHHLLLQLDYKSLSVLLQNERLSLLRKGLHEQLAVICQCKLQKSTQNCDYGVTAILADPKLNVYYQHDKDSRDNFPSQNEFGAFKTQRDLFYKAFKHWELTHMNRSFNFQTEVMKTVRELFKLSEHATNMAHFAKLFVSQLLISASETIESPEELGLKLDQQRLNRLAQRLVTSNSSVEDQFPRTQAFFRDFIYDCGSMAFLVQLKLALYAQLLRYNDSTFELMQVSFGNSDSINQVAAEQDETSQQFLGPYVVRPQVLASMLMLAKFLGFVTALPYNRQPNAGATSTSIDGQQLQLRSHFQPDFDLRALVERSMHQGKLLVTLPWLVQYLTMLDIVTLHLPNYVATLELIYGLYIAVAEPHTSKLQPCAVFMVRTCIGWLLETQPSLTSNYYSYRAQQLDIQSEVMKQYLDSFCVLNRSPIRQLGGGDAASKKTSLLENLLLVACPFLQEFRVAITPTKQAQSASRSGRYRYITTRLEQLSTNQPQTISSGNSSATALVAPLSVAEQQQRKLIDAFLHSQNASMRRLLEFVTERSFKCVVKDAQQQILLPSKAQADAQVNAIISTHQSHVYHEVKHIYNQARLKACQEWHNQVPDMLDQRIEKSLQALLPLNTNNVVWRNYVKLIKSQAQAQLQQWLQSSVLQSNFYHGDLQEVASKVCRANKMNLDAATGVCSSTELCLPPDSNICYSELLCQLQQWLHCATLCPDYLGNSKQLQQLLQTARQAALQPQLPTVFYYLIGSGLVRLLQLLMCRYPRLVTQQVITLTCDVWLAPQLAKMALRHDAAAPTIGENSQPVPGIFDSLISVSFVHELSLQPCSFAILQQLLIAMLQANILHTDFLNEIFMPMFKESWAPTIWTALSQLLQNVSQYHSGGGDQNVPASTAEDEAKSHLFMEVLADLSRDVDADF